MVIYFNITKVIVIFSKTVIRKIIKNIYFEESYITRKCIVLSCLNFHTKFCFYKHLKTTFENIMEQT